MAKYRCIIWSNFSYGREYGVDSKSAIKAARQFGRAEFGEIVEICRKKTGQVLSKAAWVPELNDYTQITVGKYECYNKFVKEV